MDGCVPILARRACDRGPYRPVNAGHAPLRISPRVSGQDGDSARLIAARAQTRQHARPLCLHPARGRRTGWAQASARPEDSRAGRAVSKGLCRFPAPLLLRPQIAKTSARNVGLYSTINERAEDLDLRTLRLMVHRLKGSHSRRPSSAARRGHGDQGLAAQRPQPPSPDPKWRLVTRLLGMGLVALGQLVGAAPRR